METRVTPLRLDREDEKKMLPCRFFANGYCHKGNRCRFYHPLNMGMNSIIRVPPLPPHFSGSGGGNEIGRQSQPPPPPPQPSPASRIPQLFPMTPPMNGATRGMPPGMNGMVHHQNVNYNYQPSPPSPPYMDYDLPPQPSSNFMFDSPISAASPQNTVFNHIDWSEFLAPGQAPPPPTLVPDERHERMRMNHPESPSTSSSNEDMPPEGRSKRKLTAKEELQMKVKEIAKELAEEPVTPIHSLDSFFRNFTFNGYTASPKHKTLAQSESQTQAETSRASGDSHEVGGTSAERFSVRDMADALMEIYIASEREREGQQQQKDEDPQSA